MPNPPSEHDLGWYSDPDYDRGGHRITQDDLDKESNYDPFREDEEEEDESE